MPEDTKEITRVRFIVDVEVERPEGMSATIAAELARIALQRTIDESDPDADPGTFRAEDGVIVNYPAYDNFVSILEES